LIATLAFGTAFLGARAFATLNPTTVVEAGGIHFHHFWYGLLLISVAGWLAITRRSEKLDRAYALIYGLGAGLIGDEVGLLLTLGDYQSELTYEFFIAAISFIIIVTLITKFGRQIERDVLIGSGERLTHFGIAGMVLSTIPFAAGLYETGIAILFVGVGMSVIGRLRETRRMSCSNSDN